MRMTNMEGRFSLETDKLLDVLLAQWAERHELPETRADAIRRKVLSQAEREAGEVLDYEWWSRLFEGMTEIIRRSTDPRRYLKVVV